jgi:hypothetical protein
LFNASHKRWAEKRLLLSLQLSGFLFCRSDDFFFEGRLQIRQAIVTITRENIGRHLSMETSKIAVALEVGPNRRVFAQALDWIGWCRAGKDEVTALHQLVIAGPRYAPVAARAGLTFAIPPSFEAFEVVERVPGNATTDFGAPAVLLPSDQKPLTEADIERLTSLLTACWSTFDDVLYSIPADLRSKKPERGRSPDAMRQHVLEADLMHLSGLGPAFRRPDPARVAEQEAEVRKQIIAALQAVPRNADIAPRRKSGFSWTPRFAARRSAWHALDHAWELQGRLGK